MALTDFSAIYFCTDEDVLLEAQGDYDLLLPDGQKLAIGDDGSVLAGGWVLTSASVNFTTQGVASGDVVFLEGISGAAGAAARSVFGPSGEPVVIDSVIGLTATLRRPGLTSGIGEPIGDGDALTGIKFSIYTLRPQIKTSSDWVRRVLDFDQAADLIDDSEIRRLTVLDTLYRLCLSAIRQATMIGGMQGGGGSTGDVWAVKAGSYKRDRDELLSTLVARRRSLDAVDSIGVVPIDR
jgi:hypothetical protein